MTEEAVAKITPKMSSRKAPAPVKKEPAPAKKAPAPAKKAPAKVQQKRPTAQAASKRAPPPNDSPDTLSDTDCVIVDPPKRGKTRKVAAEEVEEHDELEEPEEGEELVGPDTEDAGEGEDEDIEMGDEDNLPAVDASSAVSEKTME